MILGWLTLLPTLGKMRGAGGMPAGVFLLVGNELMIDKLELKQDLACVEFGPQHV